MLPLSRQFHGDGLNALRESINTETRREIMRMADVTPADITNYLNGSRYISRRNAGAIHRALVKLGIVEPVTQDDIVLRHLRNSEGLTQPEAADLYNIWRLAAVVHRLRQDHTIESIPEGVIVRYCLRRGE